MGNFDDKKAAGGAFFNWFQDNCYDKDKEIYELQLTEIINIYGVACMYYVVTYSTAYDPLFGEDDNRTIARRFPLKALFELPKELEQYAKFGIEGLDVFPMTVSKRHFAELSQYDTSGVQLFPVTSGSSTSAYPETKPQVGDLIRSEYNNRLYEIIDVGQEEEGVHLEKKHAWIFTVRVFRDESLSLSATTSASLSSIDDFIGKDDILKSDDAISNETSGVIYSAAPGEEDSEQDPLGGWWD